MSQILESQIDHKIIHEILWFNQSQLLGFLDLPRLNQVHVILIEQIKEMIEEAIF